MTDQEICKVIKELNFNTTIISSELAGLGKTEYIKEVANKNG